MTTYVERICAVCAVTFSVPIRRLRFGRGVCCSKSCASRRAGKAGAARTHALHPQIGSGNFNFRGWRSRSPILYVQRFKRLNPEKAAAHHIVFRAVRAGRLVRPSSCSDCGVTCRPHAHHDDYAHPLRVRWLCFTCHPKHDLARREAVQKAVA